MLYLVHMNWILSALRSCFWHFTTSVGVVLIWQISLIVLIKCADWSPSSYSAHLWADPAGRLAQHIFCSLLDQLVMLENNREIDYSGAGYSWLSIPGEVMINNLPSAPAPLITDIIETTLHTAPHQHTTTRDKIRNDISFCWLRWGWAGWLITSSFLGSEVSPHPAPAPGSSWSPARGMERRVRSHWVQYLILSVLYPGGRPIIQ